jgi:hypothetical protein
MTGHLAAPLVYALCALASLTCTILLWRSHGQGRPRLLFLVGACFAGLTIHNLLLFVDLVLLPSSTDLTLLRSSFGLATMAMFLFVLIWEGN